MDALLDGTLGEAGATEDAILRAAAVRHCRAQAGLDLARAGRWLRLADVTYQRLDGLGLEHSVEVVSLLLVDATACLPDAAAWPEAWRTFQAAAHGALLIDPEPYDSYEEALDAMMLLPEDNDEADQ